MKNRIRRSLFYGVIVDETTDNGTRQRLIIYIKFLDVDADGLAVLEESENLDAISPFGGNSGATYRSDYVELYNPTASPISMTGWSLQ